MREYLDGGETYSEIAKRYGLSLTSVSLHGKDGGWARIRREKRKACASAADGVSQGEGAAEADNRTVGGSGTDGGGAAETPGDNTGNAGGVPKADEERIRGVAEMLLDKISDGITTGDIPVSGANVRQLTATVKDIMEILGVMTPAAADEHRAKLEKMRHDDGCDRVVSVVFGEAEEFCE